MHHHVSDPARLRGGPTVGFALCRPADMCAATCWGGSVVRTNRLGKIRL